MDEPFRFENFVSTPVRTLRAVTPNDDADLPDGICKCLFVGTPGPISIVAADDSVAVVVTVPQGVLPIRAKRVRATGTTASAIVAGY
jgi:hypothetical protein